MTFASIFEARRDHETAFLPAALEIIETPASPIGRAIGATIIVLFCAVLAWASLCTVDIVTVAPGRIVPNDRTKVIQPVETGVVRAIHVRDGEIVKAGDILIELDPTISDADVEHVKSDLISAQLDEARLRAALSSQPDPLKDFTPPGGASEKLLETQRRLLATQVAEHDARLAEIDRQLIQKNAERQTITATLAKLEAIISPLEERVGVRQYLYDKQVGSKLAYLTEYQELVGQKHDLLIQRSRLEEADAAIAGLTETRLKAAAEYRRTLLDDLVKAEQHTATLTQDLVKAERRAGFQVLTAPIDGIVQQLAVHTVGGVVTPAQTIALVVPLGSELEIEAMVPNHEIGFVAAGQDAEIKVGTFDFTRYGLLHGRVRGVSRDAIVGGPQGQASRDTPTGVAPPEPAAQDPAYVARISLDRTDMQVDGKSASLLAGMAVTVEIKTGSRRVIGYLLSPLARYGNEAMHER